MGKADGVLEGDWGHLLNWLDWLPTPIVIQGEGDILYANAAALNLFHARIPEEFIGRKVLDFVHSDSMEIIEERLATAASADPYLPRIEEKLVRVDGEVFHAETMGVRISFRGQPATAAFIRDVTKQKTLERKSLEADKLVHTLWDAMPLPMFYKDRKGVYRYVNKPYLRLAGLPAEEILGKTSKECWPDPYGDRFHREDLEVMAKKESIVIREAIQTKDGEKMAGFLHLTPILDPTGDVLGILGIYQETTEVEAAWTSLEDEKERLLTLIDASPDMICFKDGEGRWLLANRADLELFQLNGVAYQGKTGQELAEETHPVYRQAFETCSRTDEAAWEDGTIRRSIEVFPTTEGPIRIFDIYKVPLFNPDGSRKGLVVIGRDITYMLKMEEKIRESEETTRAVLEAIPDFIFTLDGEGRFLTSHTRNKDLLYLPPEDLIGKKVAEILPAEVAQLVLSHLPKVLETGERPTFSYTLPLKGVSRRFECRMVPKGDGQALAIVRDVTERWNAYQQLKKGEKRFREMSRLFRLIADNNPDMLWAKDLNNRYIFTNRAIREGLLMAKDAAEPLGKDDLYFADRIRAERLDRKDWHTFGELCIDSDEVTLKARKPMRFDEYGNVRGKFLRLDVAKAPLFDEEGHLIGTVGSARDVTREKELEEREREAQEELTRLATVIRQASQVVVITDLQGNILYANPAFEKTTGYTLEEVRGKNPRILQSGRHERKFYKTLWDMITAGKTWEGTFVNKRKDGEIYYERAVIFPIRDRDGRIIQYAAVKQDITREKVLEEQFLHAQRMEAVGTLSGGIAHDFNNLLSVMTGYCELGLQKIDKNAPGYHELSAILSETKRAGNLVSQLLAFSRKQVTRPKLLDINETVSFFEKMFQRLLPEDITLTLNLTPGLPYIEADPGQIEQILMNLVINARDAIRAASRKAGEKEIIIGTGRFNIDTAFVDAHYGAVQGRYVTITVSDTGIGMDEATKARIFEPFFTTKKTGEGTGLGLSTVFGIVEQNRGYITVDSEPQQGATFTIYWRASRKSSKANAKDTSSGLYPTSGNETILFVEDVAELCKIASEALKSLGYTVITASNGLKALEIFEEKGREIDLVVTDLVMPGLNGAELVERLKRRAPHLRVLYTSGYVQNDGFLEKDILFLQKPYTLAQLSSKIREVLEK